MTLFGESDLNPPQLQAVHHDGGPLLLLAGAGSGKTRVITYRLAELLRRGADPERIMAVTFTNKAAGELRGRTEKLVEQTFGATGSGDAADADLPWPLRPRRPRVPRWIGTFHSIGARLLRRLAPRAGLPQDFVILDEDDQLKVCKQLCEEFKLDELAMPPRALRAAIDRAKNQCILPETYRGHDYFTDLVAKLYARYKARLLELGAADFGDLLLWPVVLCERAYRGGGVARRPQSQRRAREVGLGKAPDDAAQHRRRAPVRAAARDAARHAGRSALPRPRRRDHRPDARPALHR